MFMGVSGFITEELTTHMRCAYTNIEEAMEMYNLDVEECRSA